MTAFAGGPLNIRGKVPLKVFSKCRIEVIKMLESDPLIR